MKTAISVPDLKAERHARVAAKHHLNRSEFYVQAADRYADELEGTSDLTAVADAVIARVGQPGDETRELRERVAREHFGDDEW